ncbi:MAG: hypothetical protein QNK03_21070 [Myxococcota bacterium]|nr:hypothetical protein [Myxococcota bacterium]
MQLREIEGSLVRRSLTLLGAFHPEPGDAVPPLEDGRPAGTLVLVGNVGPAMWRAFTREQPAGPDPLDTWAEARLREVAAPADGRVLMPRDEPAWPFQRWALRAGAFHRSPIGILVHPDFGLWSAFRGAIAYPDQSTLDPPDTRPGPCTSCAERACLSTCPVGAFTVDGYDHARCAAHVRGRQGRDCRGEGCRARRACPVAPELRYAPAQARHHMDAFLGLTASR